MRPARIAVEIDNRTDRELLVAAEQRDAQTVVVRIFDKNPIGPVASVLAGDLVEVTVRAPGKRYVK